MTDTQLALVFDAGTAQRFEEFHEANPHVYTTLTRLAREWVAATGRHHLGISVLFERARWDLAIATNSADFKLNNNYRAFYARLIMWRETDLAALFDLRVSAADEWIARYAS